MKIFRNENYLIENCLENHENFHLYNKFRRESTDVRGDQMHPCPFEKARIGLQNVYYYKIPFNLRKFMLLNNTKHTVPNH